MPVKGNFSSNANVKGHSESVTFLVINVNSANIFIRIMLLKFSLGWANTYRKLKLPVVKLVTPDINVHTVKYAAREFPDLFSNKLGCIKDVEVHVNFHPDAKPKFYNARNIPLVLKSKVKLISF